MPEIIVKLGERIIHRYFFDKDSLSIGRARDNDIVIENLSVSRNHAKIKKDGDKFTLTDMNSANGTLVNGVRVTKADVVHNDQLTVGKHTLVFLNQDGASAVSLTSPKPTATGAPIQAPASAQTGGPKLNGLIGIVSVTKGKQAGQVFRAHKAETTIGRAPESDIRLHDWFVSKKHACIYRSGDNYTLRDLDSWRGTTVNGATVKEHALSEGDEIIFGTTVLVFKAVDAELAAKILPPQTSEPLPDADSEWNEEDHENDVEPISARVEPSQGPASTADKKRPVAPPPVPPRRAPEGATPMPSDVAAQLEGARATPTGTLDFQDLKQQWPKNDKDAIKVTGVTDVPVVTRDIATGVEDEFAPMTDEELAALEEEADSHEGTSEEERENRHAAWELAQSEKEFELGKDGFSFQQSHEELQAEEDSFVKEDQAKAGLARRASSDEISNRQLVRENVEEEKALFGGDMPEKEGEERAEVALASSVPVADSRGGNTSNASKPSDSLSREIAMWEKALHNKSVVIRKNAAKELKKLTGKEYDWHSEPGGS